MDINKKLKDELEGRVKKLEDFIANKGFGSVQLTKARKAQRNINLAVFLGSVLAVAGITLWALNREHE